MAARRGRAAAGRGDERGRRCSGGVERELGGARASAGHLEHDRVVGGGGERPERAGDASRRRRGVVVDGGDLPVLRFIASSLLFVSVNES